MKVLGVDPGIHGGLAIVLFENGPAPVLVDVIDVPTAGTGAAERVDVSAVASFIKQHHPAYALVERSQALPKQGSSSGFKYGRATGSLEATIICCGVPMSVIEPAKWKALHHLRGPDKEQARQRALQLFPSRHELFKRKKDHGRAEAALIAFMPVVGVQR